MPKILLVTTAIWSCAERVAGALGDAHVEAVFPAGHAVAMSRHLDRAHAYRALMPLHSIRRAMARAEPDLVIPCEDRAAAMLADIHARGTEAERALLKRSLGAPERFAELFDRNHFIAEAVKAGAPAAGMMPAPDEAALERGIDCFGLPLVIKSDSSWGGEGVVIAHTKAEAYAAWRKLSRTPSRARTLARALNRRDLHFLLGVLEPRPPVVGLQRFIAGRPATSSVLCWQGEVLAANHFDVEVARHDTGPASVLTRRDCGQMDDSARRIARHFGLSGLIGLDYVRESHGPVHLLEINPRATPSCHLALGPGHDPCGALLERLGTPFAHRPAVTQNRQIALFPQEWRRAPDSPWLASAFHDVPWDDPGVVGALAGGGPAPAWGLAGPAGLNDDFAGEFDKLLVLQGLKDDWAALALTIRQSARQ